MRTEGAIEVDDHAAVQVRTVGGIVDTAIVTTIMIVIVTEMVKKASRGDIATIIVIRDLGPHNATELTETSLTDLINQLIDYSHD